MRKSLMFLALSACMMTAVSSYACDGDKACAMKTSTKATTSCCSKHGKHTKATASKAKDCCKDMKAAKASQDTKACCKPAVKKS